MRSLMITSIAAALLALCAARPLSAQDAADKPAADAAKDGKKPAADAKKEEKKKETIKIGGQLFGSMIAKQGTVDSLSTIAGLDLTVEKKKAFKFILKGLYNEAETNDFTTARNAHGLAKFDYYLIQDRCYVYISEAAMKDKFQDLRLRSISSAGLGYNVIKKKDAELAAEAGLAYTVERYILNPASDEDRFGLRLAALGKKKFDDFLTLADSVSYVPSLEDSHYTFRNEFYADFLMWKAWSLRLGHIYEYNKKPPAGFDNDDQTFIVALKFVFGAMKK
jgi:putative salt-induced outer membrane protein YdiY